LCRTARFRSGAKRAFPGFASCFTSPFRQKKPQATACGAATEIRGTPNEGNTGRCRPVAVVRSNFGMHPPAEVDARSMRFWADGIRKNAKKTATAAKSCRLGDCGGLAAFLGDFHPHGTSTSFQGMSVFKFYPCKKQMSIPRQVLNFVLQSFIIRIELNE